MRTIPDGKHKYNTTASIPKHKSQVKSFLEGETETIVEGLVKGAGLAVKSELTYRDSMHFSVPKALRGDFPLPLSVL